MVRVQADVLGQAAVEGDYEPSFVGENFYTMEEITNMELSTLERIEREVERLTPQEQWELVKKLMRELRKKMVVEETRLDWGELYGLGKGLWDGEDAQAYVNRLRKDRP